MTRNSTHRGITKDRGDRGEADVVRRVKCPNCDSALMKLPPSFPLYDVQCTRCLFRAQVKSAGCPPKSEVFGSGWNILEKNRRVGHMIPPLIVNFHWTVGGRTSREVYFFPFLTRVNLRPRERSVRGKRPGYREFNYIQLFAHNVPRMLLTRSGINRARRRRGGRSGR